MSCSGSGRWVSIQPVRLSARNEDVARTRRQGGRRGRDQPAKQPETSAPRLFRRSRRLSRFSSPATSCSRAPSGSARRSALSARATWTSCMRHSWSRRSIGLQRNRPLHGVGPVARVLRHQTATAGAVAVLCGSPDGAVDLKDIARVAREPRTWGGAIWTAIAVMLLVVTVRPHARYEAVVGRSGRAESHGSQGDQRQRHERGWIGSYIYQVAKHRQLGPARRAGLHMAESRSRPSRPGSSRGSSGFR